MIDCERIDQIVSDSEGPGVPHEAQEHIARCARCSELYGALGALDLRELRYRAQAADRLDGFVAGLIQAGTRGSIGTEVPQRRSLGRIATHAARKLGLEIGGSPVPIRSPLTPEIPGAASGRAPRPSWLREIPERLLTGPLPERAGRRKLQLVEVEGWISNLNSIPPASKWSPDEILEAAEPKQVTALCEVLGLPSAPAPTSAAIVDFIGRTAGHSVVNLLRSLLRRRELGSLGIRYDEVVRDVAILEKIPFQAQEPVSALEEKMVRNRFRRFWEELEPAKREELLRKFDEEAARHGRSFGTEAKVAGALALANASGFGVYMLASSLVGSLSGVVGGLSFGFYTAMSKTIAAAIPGGLAAVGAFALYKLQAPNARKTMLAVFHIAAMRLYLQDRLDTRLAQLRVREIDLQDQAEPDLIGLPSRTPSAPSRRRSWWIPVFVIAAAIVLLSLLWELVGNA